MLYCVSLLEKPIKKGELLGKCVFDYTDKQFLHFMLFFSSGKRALCWTLNSDSTISSTVAFSFSGENEGVCVCMQ